MVATYGGKIHVKSQEAVCINRSILYILSLFGDSIALLGRRRTRTAVSTLTSSLHRLLLYAVIEWLLWVVSHFEMEGWGIGSIETAAITKSITKS